MPSSHFSFSPILPVASGCFRFFLAFFFPASIADAIVLALALLADLQPLFSSPFLNSRPIVAVVLLRLESFISAEESWTPS